MKLVAHFNPELFRVPPWYAIIEPGPVMFTYAGTVIFKGTCFFKDDASSHTSGERRWFFRSRGPRGEHDVFEFSVQLNPNASSGEATFVTSGVPCELDEQLATHAWGGIEGLSALDILLQVVMSLGSGAFVPGERDARTSLVCAYRGSIFRRVGGLFALIKRWYWHAQALRFARRALREVPIEDMSAYVLGLLQEALWEIGAYELAGSTVSKQLCNDSRATLYAQGTAMLILVMAGMRSDDHFKQAAARMTYVRVCSIIDKGLVSLESDDRRVLDDRLLLVEELTGINTGGT